LERDCRTRARQVLDAVPVLRTRSIASSRKQTRAWTRDGLDIDRGGRLVARWLGQGGSFHKWVMPMASLEHVRERG
jgi:hypothetical protein